MCHKNMPKRVRVAPPTASIQGYLKLGRIKRKLMSVIAVNSIKPMGKSMNIMGVIVSETLVVPGILM
jgi:hypothetical protein